MIDDVRKITLFTGNLGSGKTELAINYALWLKERYQQVGIVDLDIVNPYFRTRIMRDYLEQKGLRVVCPSRELAGADVPALSPSILGVLEDDRIKGVFDVGGDEIGATALGRFKPYLPEGSYHMLFVANACRPFTGTADGIIKMLRSVEKASRLRVTAIVSNTNLGMATDPDIIQSGHAVIKEVAQRLNLPLAFLAAECNLVQEMSLRFSELPVFPVKLHMLPPWMKDHF